MMQPLPAYEARKGLGFRIGEAGRDMPGQPLPVYRPYGSMEWDAGWKGRRAEGGGCDQTAATSLKQSANLEEFRMKGQL